MKMVSNEHPDMSGSEIDDGPGGWTDDRMEDAFRAGAAQMREMLARFVEQGGSPAERKIASSMRLNWVPTWGKDPGKPDDVHDDMWAAI
jgi:hypothetical protein